CRFRHTRLLYPGMAATGDHAPCGDMEDPQGDRGEPCPPCSDGSGFVGRQDATGESADHVDELLAGCLDQPLSRWQQELAMLCDRHPTHAEELRRRFARLVELAIIPAP